MSSFRIPEPRKRSGSAASLHLARSRRSSDDPPSARKPSFGFTPIRRASASGGGDGSASDGSWTKSPQVKPADAADAAEMPLPSLPSPFETEYSPTTPTPTPRTAAAAPKPQAYDYELSDSDTEETLIVHAPRVQFGGECVEVFDPESDFVADREGFEKPRGRELVLILGSCAVLVLVALAAGLTTIFDWVL